MAPHKTAISWTKYTNNAIRFRNKADGKVGWHCQKVSDGCKHCYAETLNMKFGTKLPFSHASTEQLECFFDEKMIGELYKIKDDHAMVFMFDMTDLFADFIPDLFRAAAWCVMLDLAAHIFQLLTKRAHNTIDWEPRFLATIKTDEFKALRAAIQNKKVRAALDKAEQYTTPWADNIWMGTSVEDSRVLKRIDDLRQCSAKTRFISAEPLIGAWGTVNLEGIHWIIVGGESGKHLTPDNPRWLKQEWAREIKNQCVDQGVAFFMKQDSGIRTELRTYLVEPDDTHWKWEQWPRDLVPPKLITPGLRWPESDNPAKWMQFAFDMAASSMPMWLIDNAAITAAYLFNQQKIKRETTPMVNPPVPDDLPTVFKAVGPPHDTSLPLPVDAPVENVFGTTMKVKAGERLHQGDLVYIADPAGQPALPPITEPVIERTGEPVDNPVEVPGPVLNAGPIIICTAQMSVPDADELDITVMSAKSPEGMALAPTWEMVNALKSHHWAENQYRERYMTLLRSRYKADPAPFLQILNRKRVVLKCYCPAGEFCHRRIAVEILTKIAESKEIPFLLDGEIMQERANIPHQIALF